MRVARGIIRSARAVARGAALLAATLAGISVVSPFAAGQSTKDDVAGAILTPRFYRIEASGGMKSHDGSKMCFGGDALRQMVKTFIAKDPDAFTELNKGCTTKTTRDGNVRSIERDCDEAAGAAQTSHLRISGTMDEVHQHFDVTMKGLGSDGADKTVISDTIMTYLGDCPANIKPGEFLRPDGTIYDPVADLQRLAKQLQQSSGAASK
jgi:hypothetical protein